MSDQEFGTLRGIKVLSMSKYFAGPYASALFSENGADVIHIESAQSPDNARYYKYAFTQEHRNQRVITLDISKPEGSELFVKLLKWCDVFLEASKGGTFARWGFSDEELWKLNPKMIITHISGYGQWGDPEYVKRPSYDMTSQAFSGLLNFSGPPSMPPFLYKPNTGDYITGLQAMWATLAAYIRMLQTGVGESVDVAQHETLLRIQSQYPSIGFTDGEEYQRVEGIDPVAADQGIHQCKDGFVLFAIGGKGPIGRALKLFGLEDDPDLKGANGITKKHPGAKKWMEAEAKFAAEHTVEEVETIFTENGIPCSRIMKYSDMMANPHYQAREDIIEYYDPCADKMIKGPAPCPRFTNNPQKILRGGGYRGQDNEDVLKEFGYTDEQIAQMYANETIVKQEGEFC